MQSSLFFKVLENCILSCSARQRWTTFAVGNHCIKYFASIFTSQVLTRNSFTRPSCELQINWVQNNPNDVGKISISKFLCRPFCGPINTMFLDPPPLQRYMRSHQHKKLYLQWPVDGRCRYFRYYYSCRCPKSQLECGMSEPQFFLGTTVFLRKTVVGT